MAAVNMYKLLPKDLQTPMRMYPSFPDYRIQLPFRMCVCAGSGKGKTNATVQIALRLNCFRRYIWIVKKKDEVLMQFWRRLIEKQMQRDPQVELIEGSTFDDLPPISTMDPQDDRNTLLVIDDSVIDKDQYNAMQYFLRGRSIHCSIAYLTQKFHQVPIFVRQQLTHVALLELDSIPEAQKVLREYGDAKELMPFYRQIIETPFAWLLLDFETRFPTLKYRDCFGDLEENRALPLEYIPPQHKEEAPEHRRRSLRK